MMFKCHCRTCQMVSGGSFTPVILMPIGGFKLLQGNLRRYGTDSVKGGHNLRGFCDVCGSRITGAETDRWIAVTASSLDDPAFFKPTSEVFTSHAQPWDPLDPALPHFPEYPKA